MTAAQRKLPAPSNGGSDAGSSWFDTANVETGAQWKCIPTWLTTVAGTNTITATSDVALVVAITAYARPMAFYLVPANDNTGAVTINIDTIGAVAIKDVDGSALPAGALKANRAYLIIYDGANFRKMDGSLLIISNGAPMILHDEKASGTPGGTFTAGSFVTRTLNTINSGTIAGASLGAPASTNQFTLPAGTYYVEWSAPAANVTQHVTQLFNVTDSAIVEAGTSEWNTAAQTRSEGCVNFTITTAKAFELRHRCVTTQATNGFGVFHNFSKEVYSVVKIWKTA